MARIVALHRDPSPSAAGPVGPIASTGLVVLSAALCFTNSGPLRWLAGVALLLILPGDAVRRLVRVGAATVPGAVITICMSLVLTIIVGVVVDQTGAGISARTMAVGLLAVTLLANIAVALSNRKVTEEPVGPVEAVGPAPGASGVSGVSGASGAPSSGEADHVLSWPVAVLCLALFAVPAGIAIGVAVHSAKHQTHAEAVAALSIQRQGQDAVVEVDQAMAAEATYVLQVTTGSRELVRMKFALRPGARRDFLVSKPAVQLGQRLTATLTLPGATQPLRSVWLVNTGQ